MKELNSETKSRVTVDDVVIVTSREKPFPIYTNVLNDVIKYANFPENFTHVDLFTYVLVAANMLDEYYIATQRRKKLWTMDSLEGVLVQQTRSNKDRRYFYKRLKDEAEKIRKEVNWDGRQPEQFTKWKFTKDDVAEDDYVVDRKLEARWIAQNSCEEEWGTSRKPEEDHDEKTRAISVGAPYRVTAVANVSCHLGDIRRKYGLTNETMFYELKYAIHTTRVGEIVIQDKSSLQFFGGSRARSLLGIGKVDADITSQMLEKFYIWRPADLYENVAVEKGTRCLYY
eukprot:Phypoly_transcript_07805.p1 GENE.Phypoly_transcript_07805~~Phypoly_transcript_07805.p1  ORF type:complete len:319 (+),score=49.77 Phypoly_transcript_07805:103-957(+)